MKTVAAIAAGALGGIFFVLSCGDDSPGDVDAAICDCPAAEPPLDGRIVSVESTPQDLPANGTGGAEASCPAGGIVLSGGCQLVSGTGVFLTTSNGFDPTAKWVCGWENTTVEPTTGVARVTCLVPAE